MKLKNTIYYFGSIPEEEVGTFPVPEGWDERFEYRFHLNEEQETVTLESWTHDSVAVYFSDLWEVVQTIAKVQQDVAASSIGAPTQEQ